MYVYHSNNGDGTVENNDANSSSIPKRKKNMPLISLNANSFIVRIFAAAASAAAAFADIAVLSHIIIHIVSLVRSQKWFKHIHCNL